MSDPAPLLSSLTERLRGNYRLGVNDCAGPLNGSMEFARQFETPPIQREAADRIEKLEGELARLADVAQTLMEEVTDPGVEAFAALYCSRVLLASAAPQPVKPARTFSAKRETRHNLARSWIDKDSAAIVSADPLRTDMGDGRQSVSMGFPMLVITDMTSEADGVATQLAALLTAARFGS